MIATKKQAINNDRNLSLKFKGSGHYYIECDYYGKRIGTITTDMPSVDDFRSDTTFESDRVREGYNSLINQIIRNNKL